MICTDYKKYFEISGEFISKCFKYKRYAEEVKFNHYIHDRSTIMSATVVFTKAIFEYYQSEIPERMRIDWQMPDTPLWLYIALKSRIRVLPDSTAIYRIREVSKSRMTDKIQQFRFIEKGYEIPLFFASNYPVKQNVKT